MHPRCGSAALAGPWRSLSGRPQSFSQTAARGGRSPKGATMNRFPRMTISALLAAATLAAAPDGLEAPSESAPEEPVYPTEEPLPVADTFETPAFVGDEAEVLPAEQDQPAELAAAAPEMPLGFPPAMGEMGLPQPSGLAFPSMSSLPQPSLAGGGSTSAPGGARPTGG